MEGKIFTESSNINEDRAKILFNYYQQAAEKIVREEERLEKEIAVLEEERAVKKKELSKAVYWLFLFFLLIPIVVYLVKKKSLTKEITEFDIKIAEFRKLHDEIFRDYKVTKLGMAYVPVADQIKYDDKSFIVDYTGKVNESEVTLQLSRQNDLLIETIADLENLSTEAPIVETSNETEEIDTEDYSRSLQQINQHDYFGKLERSLRTISYCMNDLDTASVTLPLVADKSDYLHFLREHATSEVPDSAPIIKVFDDEKYAESVSKFQELNKLKDSLSTKTAQFEDVLKGLMVTMANSVQAISALKIASTDKVIFESNKILYQILKSPYNHYSPTLEFTEIERIRNEKFDYSESAQGYEPFQLKPSSKVKYNLLSGTWTAEDGSTTNFPFGVHQIFEEIVAPVVQNLMHENRIERLKIYNHIKDQKIDYLNKWHQDTDNFYRANRSESADIINLMQDSLREYVASYNTLVSLQKTQDSMVMSGGSLDSTVVNANENLAETLLAFEMQSKEFQNIQTSFEEYIERIKEDIELKAERFGHIEFYDAKLRDGHSNEIAVAAGEVRNLDERRKPLASVNPLFAKQSELPPAPSVESITFEHISLNLPAIAKNALAELQLQEKLATETLEDEHTKNLKEILENETSAEMPAESETSEQIDAEAKSIQGETQTDEAELIAPEESEEESEEENEEENEEEQVYDNDALCLLDDEEIQEICDAMKIEYNERRFDRLQAITNILETQNADEHPIFDADELNAMSDEEIKKIGAAYGIPYDDDDFCRDSFIDEILDAQNNSDNL